MLTSYFKVLYLEIFLTHLKHIITLLHCEGTSCIFHGACWDSLTHLQG